MFLTIQRNGRTIQLASRPEYGDTMRVFSIDGTRVPFIAFVKKSEIRNDTLIDNLPTI